MTRPVIVVDVETTGLDPERHEVWEIAVIERATGTTWCWCLEPGLDRADPQALKIGQFAERTEGMRRATAEEVRQRYGPRPPLGHLADVWDLSHARWDLSSSGRRFWSDPADLAPVLSRMLSGVTLVAANPAFDAGFLSAFLARHGVQSRPWHYRMRDIGSMAWAYLQAHHLPHHLPTPAIDAGTDDLAREMGIEPDDFGRHSALGDCKLVAAMLDVIERGPVS